jgi:hypothetical protein
MTVQELAEKITELVTEARKPLPERSHPLTAEDFVKLWHGDEHSMGYAHVFLAHEVMRLNKYSSLDFLRAKFYPCKAEDEIPPEARKTLEAAFGFYDKRRQAEADG